MVVIRQRQRQHGARHKLTAIPHRLNLRSRDTENTYFWRRDNGCKTATANGAEAGYGEEAALHIHGRELAIECFCYQGVHLVGQLPTAILFLIKNDRKHKASWGIY